MVLGADSVKFQPRTGSVTPIDALNLLIGRMQAVGIETNFAEGRKTISLSVLRKRVETKGTWGHLETVDLSLQYGVAASYEHCFVSIREKVANAAGDWESWAMPFVMLDGFVEGWLVDVEYNHWQNAKDPIEYEAAGRDFSHLPMRSNGLPDPLGQMEIDTSRNPGRWLLRSGYVEAIGSTMWLSELFWNRVGKDRKARLNSVDWLYTTQLDMGIVEVRTKECLFISEETADMQNRLRACLYG